MVIKIKDKQYEINCLQHFSNKECRGYNREGVTIVFPLNYNKCVTYGMRDNVKWSVIDNGNEIDKSKYSIIGNWTIYPQGNCSLDMCLKTNEEIIQDKNRQIEDLLKKLNSKGV